MIGFGLSMFRYCHCSKDEILNPKIQWNSYFHPSSGSSQATLHDEIKVLSHGGWWSGLLRELGGGYTFQPLCKQLYQTNLMKRRGWKACWKRWGLVVWTGMYVTLIIKSLSFISHGTLLQQKRNPLYFFDSLTKTTILFSFMRVLSNFRRRK